MLLSELPPHLPPEINVASMTGFFCCPTALPRNRKLLRVIVHSGQRRRSRKRIVQPRPQIAVEEQLLPQQRRQRRQGPRECRFQLQVLQHQHRDQRRPHLGPDRIGAGAHECLDL